MFKEKFVILNVVQDEELKTYKASSKDINLEPELVVFRSLESKCEVCGSYNKKLKTYTLEKECFLKSRFQYLRPDTLLTNLPGLITNSSFRADTVKVVARRNKAIVEEKILRYRQLDSAIDRFSLTVENNKEYEVDVSVLNYSIRRSDGSILSKRSESPK